MLVPWRVSFSKKNPPITASTVGSLIRHFEAPKLRAVASLQPLSLGVEPRLMALPMSWTSRGGTGVFRVWFVQVQICWEAWGKGWESMKKSILNSFTGAT